MTIVYKMRRTTLIFHVLIIVATNFQCTSVMVAANEQGGYIDLDEDTSLIVEESLKQEIKKFYGAPYSWGGSTPSGTDCSGMVKTVYKNAANIDLPHNADAMFRMLKSIHPQQMRLGDLVFFSNNGGRRITHMGIYIQDGYFVHASSSRGVVLSKLNEKYYKQQFVGAARVN